MTTEDSKLVKVVILTALQQEYNAVREHLDEIEEIDEKGTLYEQGKFRLEENPVAIVIIRECGQSIETASQEVQRAISAFSPNMMFFVGIAGSRKPQDFNIGDVIFGDKIYHYDSGRDLKNDFNSRPDSIHSTYLVTERARVITRNNDWKTLFKGGEETNNFKAGVGIIASGGKLIEDYNSHIGKVLIDHYNDSQAVEMEGFGFAKAIERQSKRCEFGVIRGISDVLAQDVNPDNDFQKQANISTNTDRRPENNKVFASRTAAAFTYYLIFKLVGQKKKLVGVHR